MNTDQAQSAVSISAFVVAGIFAYRKLIEGSISAKSPNTAHFVIGFGFVYVFLSVAAQAAPQVGGMLAILVGAGDVLVNGQPLLDDLTKALKQTAPKGKPTQLPQSQAGASQAEDPARAMTAAEIAAANRPIQLLLPHQGKEG